MLIRLCKDSFVRQFGPYTHIFNQTHRFDETFEDAECFLKHITKRPENIESILSKVIGEYRDADVEKITADFYEFVNQLEADGVVVKGKTEQQLEQGDVGFTYSVESPLTSPDKVGFNADNADADAHVLLNRYFDVHPFPFSMHMDLTSECNEKCVHCYVPRGTRHYIDSKVACSVLRQLREMQGVMVTFSGGECLLHPKFEKILRCAREQDLSITVLSNLTLLDEAKAKLLKEVNVGLVQVSLYSMNPAIHDAITHMPGAFVKTRAAIEMLHDMDVPVQIACPCMKLNYTGYKDVLEFAYGMKMKAYTDFIMMARSDGTTDNLDNRLSVGECEQIMRTIMENEVEMKTALKEDRQHKTPEELAKEPICGVGRDSICLNADGRYYACSGFQGYTLGNCYTQTLEDVWNNSSGLKFLRGIRKGDFKSCTHCKDSEFCSMCLVRNFNETGDALKVTEHFCNAARLNHRLYDEYSHRG